MRRFLAALLALVLMLNLCACGRVQGSETAEVLVVTETAAETPSPTAAVTQPPPATPTPTAEPAFEPYLLEIVAIDLPIHSGPGYEYDSVGRVYTGEVFTIVEEATDELGLHWGRLKSGAGWLHIDANVPSDFEPYLIRIDNPDYPIYSGPGREGDMWVASVQQAGTYTIVEEAVGLYGNLWGRLKSGVGWIQLAASGVPMDFPLMARPIRAEYADQALLDSKPAFEYHWDTVDYAAPIAFFADETVWDFCFVSVTPVFDGTAEYEIGDTIYWLDCMKSDTPVVIWCAFVGVYANYGITYSDADGNFHAFALLVSGKDGSLILQEIDV